MRKEVEQNKEGQSKCPFCKLTKRLKRWANIDTTISCLHYKETVVYRNNKQMDIYEWSG